MHPRQLAKAQLLESLAAIDPLGDNTDPQLPLLLSNLAAVYFLERAIEDADAISQRMILVCEQTLGQSHPTTATAYNNLAVIWGHDKKSDAAALFERALGIWTTEIEETRTSRLVALNNLTNFYVRKKEFDKALASASDAHELASTVGKFNEDAGTAANNLAVVLQHESRFDESETLHKRARDIWQGVLGENHEWVALSLLNFSSLCRQQRLHSEAERLYHLSMNIRRASAGGSLFNQLGPFFLPASPYPETGLLRVRSIKDDPLNADDVLLNSPDYVSIVGALKRDTLDHVQEYVTGMGPWDHNIEIKPGLHTNPAGGDHPASLWRMIEPFVPKDLSGKSVLDIGCNSGSFSAQMKRRGARRVVGIDTMPHRLAQARFVSRWFGQNIELREMDCYDVPSLGEFDHVVFVGLLHHLKHPLCALEKIASICKNTMYFQSAIRGPGGDFHPEEDHKESGSDIFEQPEYPKMYFVEKSLNGDVNSWWFATSSCLKAMLRTAGFREVLDTDSPDTFICKK